MPKPNNKEARTTLRNLVAAIIAVNNYPIHKVVEITSSDKPLGWVNEGAIPDRQLTAFEIKTDIMDSGYDRGDYVALLLGQRIRGCLDYALEKGSLRFFDLISGSQEAALRELPRLPGVGPKVTMNFVELQFGGLSAPAVET